MNGDVNVCSETFASTLGGNIQLQCSTGSVSPFPPRHAVFGVNLGPAHAQNCVVRGPLLPYFYLV